MLVFIIIVGVIFSIVCYCACVVSSRCGLLDEKQ